MLERARYGDDRFLRVDIDGGNLDVAMTESEHKEGAEYKEEANPSDGGGATKAAETILRQETEVGEEQLERRTSGLFMAAVSAGLDIGFGPFLVVSALAMAPVETMGARLVGSILYAVGFIIVILGRSELFTEHTILAVLPLFSGRTTISRVARVWGLVYSGNLVGAVVFAALSAPLGIALGLFAKADVARMSHHLTDYVPWVIFVSAIMAGWMMALVSWLVTAARDTTAQILIILLVAGAIYFLGLHHSIAGSVEVLMGVFVADVSLGDFLRFLGLATCGNAVGGVVFVAALKYGHISRRVG